MQLPSAMGEGWLPRGSAQGGCLPRVVYLGEVCLPRVCVSAQGGVCLGGVKQSDSMSRAKDH